MIHRGEVIRVTLSNFTHVWNSERGFATINLITIKSEWFLLNHMQNRSSENHEKCSVQTARCARISGEWHAAMRSSLCSKIVFRKLNVQLNGRLQNLVNAANAERKCILDCCNRKLSWTKIPYANWAGDCLVSSSTTNKFLKGLAKGIWSNHDITIVPLSPDKNSIFISPKGSAEVKVRQQR